MSEQPVTPDPRVQAAAEALMKDYGYEAPRVPDGGILRNVKLVLAAADAVDPRRAKTHWGVSPMHGGLTQHVGPFDECSAPDCADEPERVLERMSAELARYQAAVQAAIRFVDQVAAGEHSFGPWPGMGDFFRAEMAQLIGSDAGWIAEHLGDER